MAIISAAKVALNNKGRYNTMKPEEAVNFRFSEMNLLAPLRRPSLEFSNAAFVINLKAEVSAPDAAKPARNDCNNKNRLYK